MKMKNVFYFLLGLLLLAGGNGWALDAPGSGRESTERPPQEIIILDGTEYYALKVKDINGVSRFMVRPDGTLVVLGTSGTSRFMVKGADGSIVQYNSSGQSVFGVDAAGKPYRSWKAGVTFVNMGGGPFLTNSPGYRNGNTDYRCTEDYDTYIINTSGGSAWGNKGPAAGPSGVSIYLPTGRAALDGFKIKLIKWDSVTSPTIRGDTGFYVCPASYLVGGVTDHILDDGGVTYTSTNANYSQPAASHNRVNANGESITYVYRYVSAMSGGTWYQVDSSVTGAASGAFVQ